MQSRSALRAEASGSLETTKAALLQKHGIRAADLLGKGMEAEVYRHTPTTVLKIYHSLTTVAHLKTLQDFYASLDTHALSYALPEIYAISEEAGFPVSIEKWLPGCCLQGILPGLNSVQMETVMQAYLSAALALQSVSVSTPVPGYKLFDAFGTPDTALFDAALKDRSAASSDVGLKPPSGSSEARLRGLQSEYKPDAFYLSALVQGDWYSFLKRFVLWKLAEVEAPLTRDVTDFPTKRDTLLAWLAQPYRGAYTLIHGDFYPGNLLVDEDLNITGLLDFGMMTMFGDYLFDIATGWVFFDMYDTLRADLRERYLTVVLDRLGESARARLYLYVLIYSVLSANTYSKDCTDGHYSWCVENLNTVAYFQALR
jgi:hypothetical protein